MKTIKYYDNDTVKYVKYSLIQLILKDNNVVLYNKKGIKIICIKVKDITIVEKEFDFYLQKEYSFFNLIPYQELELVEDYTRLHKTKT